MEAGTICNLDTRCKICVEILRSLRAGVCCMTFKRLRARQVAADMGSCHCRRWCNLQKEATLGLMEPLHESIGRAAGVCSSPSSRGKLEVACAESLWRNGLATSVNDHSFAAEGHAIMNLASNRRLIWNSRSWPKHICLEAAARQTTFVQCQSHISSQLA